MEHRSWLAHPFGPFSCVRMRHACDRAIAAKIKKAQEDREGEREREREREKRGMRTWARMRKRAQTTPAVNQRDIFPPQKKKNSNGAMC